MSRSGRSRRFVSLVVLAGLMAVPFAAIAVVVTAQAAGAAITNFTDGSIGIVGGVVGAPDGGVWFTNQNRNTIGRMDASTQTVTEYTGTGISQPTGIALGPDATFPDLSPGSVPVAGARRPYSIPTTPARAPDVPGTAGPERERARISARQTDSPDRRPRSRRSSSCDGAVSHTRHI